MQNGACMHVPPTFTQGVATTARRVGSKPARQQAANWGERKQGKRNERGEYVRVVTAKRLPFQGHDTHISINADGNTGFQLPSGACHRSAIVLGAARTVSTPGRNSSFWRPHRATKSALLGLRKRLPCGIHTRPEKKPSVVVALQTVQAGLAPDQGGGDQEHEFSSALARFLQVLF
eukprot:gene18954-biopygen9992